MTGTTVVAVVVLALALMFRVEIKKLVNWVVSFKRLKKTQDGYSLEPGPEPETKDTTHFPESKIRAAELSGPAMESPPDSEEGFGWIGLMLNKKYSEAIARLDLELAAADDAEERARLRAFKGHVRYEENPAAGTRYFEEVIRDDPRQESSYHWFGFSHYLHDLYIDALSVFDRGLSVLPRSGTLIQAKADTLTKIGRTNEAVHLIRQALGSGIVHDGISMALADIYLEQKDLDAAEAVMLAAIRVAPKHETVRSKYASFLWEHGRYDEALIQYEELVGLDSKDPRYATMLGNVFLGLGMFESALRWYNRGLENSTGDAGWIYANLGNLYSSRGLYSPAIEHLRRAIELSPNYEYAHTRLAGAIAAREKESTEVEEARKRGRQKLSKLESTASMQHSHRSGESQQAIVSAEVRAHALSID